MLQKCPLCRGEFPPHESCRERFDHCLALEFENPTTYGSVHHLTVACYMLQHNAYSGDVWLEARKMVAQFIEEGVTPAQMRKRNRARFDGRQRPWSVTKGEKLAQFETITWSSTIADVRLDSAEVYCAHVKQWATAVLADTSTLVNSI